MFITTDPAPFPAIPIALSPVIFMILLFITVPFSVYIPLVLSPVPVITPSLIPLPPFVAIPIEPLPTVIFPDALFDIAEPSP